MNAPSRALALFEAGWRKNPYALTIACTALLPPHGWVAFDVRGFPTTAGDLEQSEPPDDLGHNIERIVFGYAAYAALLEATRKRSP